MKLKSIILSIMVLANFAWADYLVPNGIIHSVSNGWKITVNVTTNSKPWKEYINFDPILKYWQGLVSHELTSQDIMEIYETGLTNKPSDYETKKAMDAYWEQNKNCEFCNTSHSIAKTRAKLILITNILPGTFKIEYDNTNAFLKVISDIVKIQPGRFKRNEVHHYRPQSRAPWLRAWWDNFVTHCRHCHGFLGHGIWNGGGWNNENANLREMMRLMKHAYTNNIILIKPEK